LKNHKQWVIASSFTADLIIKPLNFLLQIFELSIAIVLTPYNQLLLELMNSSSAIYNSDNGINLLLIRISDWERDRAGLSQSALFTLLDEFVEAVCRYNTLTETPLWICFCPENDKWLRYENYLAKKLKSIGNINLIYSSTIRRFGFSEDSFDKETDRIAHLPYNNKGFTCLAVSILRSISCKLRKPYKAIVVDCDNTLWNGVCGEVGYQGIEIDPAKLLLQRFLIEQYKSGMLICLCSKNNEADVMTVFLKRKDMLLKKKHITAHCINWENKSKNLKVLSDTLNINMDSMIFIDDNPVECMEVRSIHHEVLTLILPPEEKALSQMISNIWAFDHSSITRDDMRRSNSYKQNVKRNAFLQKNQNFADFIKNLNIKLTIKKAASSDNDRISQLSYRVNQFNFTGLRWTDAELLQLQAGGEQFYCITVSDRFGDYGLVGFIEFMVDKNQIVIKNLALSCRVLNKGIEHKVIAWIAEYAVTNKLTAITIEFQKSNRNIPAQRFVRSLPNSIKKQVFQYSPVDLINIEYNPEIIETPKVVNEKALVATKNLSDIFKNNIALLAIVEYCKDFQNFSDKIFEVFDNYIVLDKLNDVQQKITAVWAGLLKIKQVSLRRNFFISGGTSLLAVQLLSRIYREFSIKISMSEFYRNATIDGLSGLIDKKLSEPERMYISAKGFLYKECYPLSASQRQLWFIEQLHPGNTAYNIYDCCKIIGDLNISALQYAINATIKKHGSLRTVFQNIKGQPAQSVEPSVKFAIDIINVKEHACETIDKLLLDRLKIPFLFQHAPLFRAHLLVLEHNTFILLLVAHHIVVDGWSWHIIKNDISYFYQCYMTKASIIEDIISFAVVEYAVNQEYKIINNYHHAQIDFWKAYLNNLPLSIFSIADVNSNFVKMQGNSIRFKLNKNQTQYLNKLSRAAASSLFSVLAAILAIVISRFSNQDDFIIGTVTAGRNRLELENVVGMFVKTILLRIKMNSSDDFIGLIKTIHTDMSEIMDNQDISYETIIKSVLPRSHGDPIKVMLVLQNAPNILALSNLKITPLEIVDQAARFELIFEFIEQKDMLRGYIHYNIELYQQKTIEKLCQLFKQAINNLDKECFSFNKVDI
jgi:FkbH-like protein